MQKLAVIVVLGGMLAPGSSLAAGALSGEDAAYIDWGVKNCGLTSTSTEHRLVDQANATGRDTFSSQYMRHYQSQPLTDALTSPSKQEAMCTDIKAWYGPQGSRIADLISWDPAASSASADRPAATKTAGHKGRRHSTNSP